MSYSDGVRILVDKEVQDDINDACSKLAYAMSTMMDKFDSIAKQMHTLDLLRHTAPLKPRWESMRKVSMPRALSRLFHIADLLKRWCANPGCGWTPLAISHERWCNFRTLKAWAFFLHRSSVCFYWCNYFSLLHRGVAYGSAECRWENRRKVSLPSRKSSSFAILYDSQWRLDLDYLKFNPLLFFFRSRLSMPR